MLSKLRPHLTYANALSTLCLFAVLGGSSYAAIALNKNSVKSPHIAKGQVKRTDLAKNAVTSGKVANGGLLAEDFAPGQLPAGERGPEGQRGPAGQAGADGAPATKLFAYVAYDSPTYWLGYGSGALGVAKHSLGADVRFNRSVHGCTAHVTPGTPAGIVGDDLDYSAIPSIHVDPDDTVGEEDDVVRVLFINSGVTRDTSFFLTVFC